MRNIRRNLFLAVILPSLCFACSPTRTVTPVSLAPGTQTDTTGVTQPSQANPPMPVPIQPGAVGTSSDGSVSLQVLSPQDGAVVNTSQIQVSGVASPGNVVTVNDEIILVGGDGQFQATISLDEGPNLIEVIASDDAGNETSVDLTVTYAP